MASGSSTLWYDMSKQGVATCVATRPDTFLLGVVAFWVRARASGTDDGAGWGVRDD